MNTIFMNSKNSKTSDSHRLLPNFTDKVNLKRIDKKPQHVLHMEKYQKVIQEQ